MHKRITALLLVLVMVLAILPVAVAASNDNYTVYQAPQALEFQNEYEIEGATLEEFGLRFTADGDYVVPVYSIQPEKTALHYGSFGTHQYHEVDLRDYDGLTENEKTAILLALVNGFTGYSAHDYMDRTLLGENTPAESTVTVSYYAAQPTISWTALYPAQVGLNIPLNGCIDSNGNLLAQFDLIGMQGENPATAVPVHNYKNWISAVTDTNNDGIVDSIKFKTTIYDSSIDYWDITYVGEAAQEPEPDPDPVGDYVINYQSSIDTITWSALELQRDGILIPVNAQNLKVEGMQGNFGSGEFWHDYSNLVASCPDSDNDGYINRIVFSRTIYDSSIDYWRISYTISSGSEEPVEPVITDCSANYEATTPTISWKALYLQQAGVLVPMSAYTDYSDYFKVIGMTGDCPNGTVWHDYTQRVSSVSDSNHDGYIDSITFSHTINDSTIDYWRIDYRAAIAPTSVETPKRGVNTSVSGEDLAKQYATQAVIYEFLLGCRDTSASGFYLRTDDSFINAVGSSFINDAYNALDAKLTSGKTAVVNYNIRMSELYGSVRVLVPSETNMPALVFIDPVDMQKLPDNPHNWGSVGAKMTDIANNAYADYIYQAIYRGDFAGTSATTFSPDQVVTRGQFITVLWRLCGSPEPAADANPFQDVKASKYYYKAILWAYQNGITSGTDATHFSPNDPLTREQVATFLYSFYKKHTVANYGNQTADTSDINWNVYAKFNKCNDKDKVHSWAKSGVQWANDNGIYTLMQQGKNLYPGQKCTRAEVAMLIIRLTEVFDPAVIVK